MGFLDIDKDNGDSLSFDLEGGLLGVSSLRGDIHLTPNEAVTLASALLQYATQNGASRE